MRDSIFKAKQHSIPYLTCPSIHTPNTFVNKVAQSHSITKLVTQSHFIKALLI